MRPTRLPALVTVLCAGAGLAAEAPKIEKPDFMQHIKPLLESACVHCHNEKEHKGDLKLTTLEEALKGGENGTALVPGDAAKSKLYSTTQLKESDDDVMPPKKEGLLTKEQSELLKLWIQQGAHWPKGVKLEQTPRISFEKHIQPLLEENCLSCHNPDKHKGDFDLTTREKAFTTGEHGPNIVAFNSEKSPIYKSTTLAADDDDLMPPKKSGGPLKKEDSDRLKAWVEQGAPWPEGVTLKAKEKKTAGSTNPDNLELAIRIHDFIVKTSTQEKAEADMKNYEGKIPKTGIPYSMIAIKGGEFLMGSPPTEKDRKEDEGPQVKVKVRPFWMEKTEVSWDEYMPFMITDVGRNKDGSRQKPEPNAPITEVVSQPTTPYTEMSFGMGTTGYPAISMTQHAANKYCEWLSAQTGHFYRLPTEQEWEYAARAGTTTAYYWGDDASKAKEYEWYYDNAPNFQYAKVGQKKPNPWGLYDMLGNVAEWTIDQYEPDYYKKLAAMGPKAAIGYYVPSKTPYPHTARGGSFDDDVDRLRCAARRASSPEWKQQDPQLPKSIWYLTDAKFMGFRIIRPLEIPSAEEMFHYWNNGVEKE